MGRYRRRLRVVMKPKARPSPVGKVERLLPDWFYDPEEAYHRFEQEANRRAAVARSLRVIKGKAAKEDEP